MHACLGSDRGARRGEHLAADSLCRVLGRPGDSSLGHCPGDLCAGDERGRTPCPMRRACFGRVTPRLPHRHHRPRSRPSHRICTGCDLFIHRVRNDVAEAAGFGTLSGLGVGAGGSRCFRQRFTGQDHAVSGSHTQPATVAATDSIQGWRCDLRMVVRR